MDFLKRMGLRLFVLLAMVLASPLILFLSVGALIGLVRISRKGQKEGEGVDDGHERFDVGIGDEQEGEKRPSSQKNT